MALFCIVKGCEKPAGDDGDGWPSIQSIAMHQNRAHGITKEERKEGVHFEQRPSQALVLPGEDQPKRRNKRNQPDPLHFEEIWSNNRDKLVMIDSNEDVWITRKVD